jgi:hypothetical protein
MLALMRLQALLLAALFAVICINAVNTLGLVGGLMTIIIGVIIGLLIVKVIR